MVWGRRVVKARLLVNWPRTSVFLEGTKLAVQLVRRITQDGIKKHVTKELAALLQGD